MLALRKRPVSRERIDEAVNRIEQKMLAFGEREIKTERLGELVMDELRRMDKIAYVRFASVYRNFEDVQKFADAAKEV